MDLQIGTEIVDSLRNYPALNFALLIALAAIFLAAFAIYVLHHNTKTRR